MLALKEIIILEMHFSRGLVFIVSAIHSLSYLLEPTTVLTTRFGIAKMEKGKIEVSNVNLKIRVMEIEKTDTLTLLTFSSVFHFPKERV